jgi:WD40 repeat protein
LKKIEVDLSAKELRYSTDWEVRWPVKDRVLIQLDCRENPARASVATFLGHLDLRTGKVLKWSGPMFGGESVHISPDGKRALGGREYGLWREDDGEIAWGGRGTTYSVALIDMVDLKVIDTLDQSKPGTKERTIVHRAWSRDSRWIATVGSDHTIGIWEGDKGKPVSTLIGHKEWVLDVAFSPDGKTVATASDDETARLWDVRSGRQLRVFAGHITGLNCVAFDSRSERILTGGEDETARLWDVTTGKQIRAWGNHESAVRSAGFEADDKRIWTETSEGVRRVWRIDGSLLSESKGAARGTDRLGVLYLKRTKADGYEIWSGPAGVPGEDQSDGGRARLRPRFTLPGDCLFQVRAVTADGMAVASASKDRTICL